MPTGQPSNPASTLQNVLDAAAANPRLDAELRRHYQDEELRDLRRAVAQLDQRIQDIADREAGRDAELRELKAEQAHQQSTLNQLDTDISNHQYDHSLYGNR